MEKINQFMFSLFSVNVQPMPLGPPILQRLLPPGEMPAGGLIFGEDPRPAGEVSRSKVPPALIRLSRRDHRKACACRQTAALRGWGSWRYEILAGPSYPLDSNNRSVESESAITIFCPYADRASYLTDLKSKLIERGVESESAIKIFCPSAVRRTPYAVRRTPYAVRRTPSAVR
ncbi:unnamed protein product, partial [Nesidiocoris tenuis]